ncbi:DNA repair protein RadC [Anoxybacillus sp. LAT_35]|uniref:JAB domain-containing protein n=1 Tax=unclassified Anoxybacillus TaxID=2639704 RepID=UPI001EEA7B28|nr:MULTISPECIES: JAB domain-containing protein [unclassified Anoxybacillus]MCG6170949.1 DNA repair protein RadC [Anoxybacillus sp. LAT_11]MCG6178830.1 DNA repair protein RadC [Anoxybacillus sp. LAT_35]MCG6182507.1 DNA repair protein RadC [Anoxybacillus sp. LAT_26]MCG6197102.1 DNA repair protein RadC [Anoxybacillus sp. LAT_38]
MQPAKRINIVSLKLVREGSVLYKERQVKSPEDAYKLLKPFLAGADREVFVVCLDTKNQPTAIHVCHVGSLNASIVHPREVFKSAILANAASVLVAHNHPSTDPTPSREDIDVTRRLVEAGRIVGIELLDHVVVGGERFVSLKEKGYV